MKLLLLLLLHAVVAGEFDSGLHCCFMSIVALYLPIDEFHYYRINVQEKRNRIQHFPFNSHRRKLVRRNLLVELI